MKKENLISADAHVTAMLNYFLKSMLGIRLAILIAVTIVPPTLLFGQAGVGIGVTNPHPSAVLHIQPPTNNKGILIPRINLDTVNILDPAEGLLVYDPLRSELLHYMTHNGVGSWQPVGMPRGAIIMWNGTTPPKGWALCDGTNGRPDLRGRFIVSMGQNQSPQNGDLNPTYTIGPGAGQNVVTLDANQIPSHNHTMQEAGEHQHFVREVVRGEEGNSGDDQSVGGFTESGTNKLTSFAGDHTHIINHTGGGQSHENRPPYYVLAFIIKL